MKGRRRPDTPADSLPPDLQAGDYWKVLDVSSGEPVEVHDVAGKLTPHVWYVACPNPHSEKGKAYLLANLWNHTVREHEDGTISVRPNDGSSNSILVNRRPDEVWHGYIEHGEFLPV